MPKRNIFDYAEHIDEFSTPLHELPLEFCNVLNSGIVSDKEYHDICYEMQGYLGIEQDSLAVWCSNYPI